MMMRKLGIRENLPEAKMYQVFSSGRNILDHTIKGSEVIRKVL